VQHLVPSIDDWNTDPRILEGARLAVCPWADGYPVRVKPEQRGRLPVAHNQCKRISDESKICDELTPKRDPVNSARRLTQQIDHRVIVHELGVSPAPSDETDGQA
jgi:hypothetical protein